MHTWHVHIIGKALSLLIGVSLACSLVTGLPDKNGPELATQPTPIQLIAFDEEALLALANPGTGRTFYVADSDPNASDKNDGTMLEFQGGNAGPWKTIQHAADSMQAGDTAFVRAGIYHEAGIHFENSGSPGQPITLARYQDEQVVLDGSGVTDELPGVYLTPGQGYFVFRGLTLRNMPWSGIATDPKTTLPYRGLVIQDSLAYDNRWTGFDLAAVEGFLVERVEAYGNQFYGLNISASEKGQISSSYGLVRASSFHEHTGNEGHGLAINQGHNISIRDCSSYHNTIHGFDATDWPKKGEVSHDLTFERNISYENGGAGFSINSDSHHVRYVNNIASHNGAAWAGSGTNSGFLCYGGCWHIEYLNNVSSENSDAGFYVQKELGLNGDPQDSLLVFKNNIAFNNGNPEWDLRPALVVEGKQWEVVAEHNNWSGRTDAEAIVVAIHIVNEKGEIYSVDQINKGLFQKGNVSVNPLFMDAKAEDYHLAAGSPMIDAGIDVGQTYCGKTPDMGALENCPSE